jgi:hypothetical protein
MTTRRDPAQVSTQTPDIHFFKDSTSTNQNMHRTNQVSIESLRSCSFIFRAWCNGTIAPKSQVEWRSLTSTVGIYQAYCPQIRPLTLQQAEVNQRGDLLTASSGVETSIEGCGSGSCRLFENDNFPSLYLLTLHSMHQAVSGRSRAVQSNSWWRYSALQG